MPIPEEERYTLEFYPNPATSVVVSKLNFALPEKFQLQILDLQGRQQHTGFQVVDNSIVINLATLRAGMYIIRVSTADKNFTTKVIKL